MSILTIKSTGYRYGYAKDASDAGDNTFYLGKTNSHTYDSSIAFKNTFSFGYPIVIKSVTLKTKKKGGSPYNSLNIHLSENKSAYPGGYTKIKSLSGAFNSNSVIITDSDFLSYIQNYLANGTTFYIHITGSNDGGTLYGYDTSDRPTLDVEWDYAASMGSLDKTSFSVAETVNLTLDVKGTGYTHDITWTVNGIIRRTESNLNNFNIPGSYIYNFNLSPSINAIDSWFTIPNKQSSGVITIITKSGGTQIGEATKIYFTIVLTAGYCESSEYVTLDIPSFSLPDQKAEPGVFIANRSRVKVTCGLRTESSRLEFSPPKLVVSGGLLGTKTGTDTVTTVIGSKALTATYTAVDSRGLSYSTTATSKAPTFYDDITLSDIKFYRTNDQGKEDILGKRIGCSFKVNSPENVDITEVLVKYSTYSSDLSEFTNPYSSTNLFGNDVDFDTSKSYELKIYIKNEITADSSLYGYANNGYYIYSVTISKAEYIIHIPEGGRGIAFGTAYTNESEAVIECGWPILASKGLEIPYGPNLEYTLNFSNYASLTSFHEALGLSGSYLSLSGGTIKGSITLANGKGLITSRNNDLLKATNNLIELGNSTDNLTIRGSSITLNSKGLYHNDEEVLTHSKFSTSFAPDPTYFDRYENAEDKAAGIIYPEQGLVLEYNGPFYTLNGAITNIKELNFSSYTDKYLIGKIDSSDAPSYTAIYVCQGKNQQIWNLRIDPDGNIYMERNRLGASYTNCPKDSRLVFHVSWIA